MPWDLKSDRPIYAQLIEQMELRILTGTYPPGSRLPSVRDMAQEAAVNPNTMQKALSQMEESGLLHTQRTSGRTVTEDVQMIQQAKNRLAEEQLEIFLKHMEMLGYDTSQTMELVAATLKRRKQ